MAMWQDGVVSDTQYTLKHTMKTTILYLYDICGMSANAIAQCLKISIEDVIEVLSEEDLA